MTINPFTLEVLRNKFDTITEEMQTVLRRSAYSSIIKEANDAGNTIFTVKGELVSQSPGCPSFLGMMIPAIQRILELFPPTEMKEGDIFIMNDPYEGGTHLPDITILMPIIHDSEMMAVNACIAHQSDMGGKFPGSKPMDATEIFQEGIIIPPLKLYDQGKVNHTLYKILEKNTRLFNIVGKDIEAMLAACRIGRRRVLSLCQQYGKDIILQCMAELLDRSELMTRKEIERIPDGTYSAVEYVDHDGVEVDKLIKIKVSVTIKGTDMTVSFNGTNPQTKGPANSTPGSTMASVYFSFRCITDPFLTIHNNAGCFRPIKLIIPKGSVINPLPPAPVNARMPTVAAVANAFLQAMSTALPAKVPATSGFAGSPGFSGVDPLTGERFAFMDFLCAGVGANPIGDGVDGRSAVMNSCLNIPTEVIEMNFPIRVKKFSLWQDSGGAGKYQGGNGIIKVYEVTRGEVTIFHQNNYQKTAPSGIYGGEPSRKQETYILRNNGDKEPVSSKAMNILHAGDKLAIYVPGGGGFGKPKKRAPEAIKQDLIDGKISKAMAKEHYGFVMKSVC
ncbi:hydantoinase B/oxoprolinase family protein [Chloroflexota bacterium]